MLPTELNPFSTRFIRPGALTYLVVSGASIESLLAQLQKNQWRGAIVAPHGTGKSTLLATLSEHWEKLGRRALSVVLHSGETTLPAALKEASTWNASTQIIVDGYEQLSWWSRRQLLRQVKHSGAGLLVTSHAATELPTIMQWEPTLEQLVSVVRALGVNEASITQHEIQLAFIQCQGNLREALFSLYDLYATKFPPS